MKYKAIIETDEYKDFEFYEDGIGKFMVGKDAGATADGGWMPLYFTECEQESCEEQEIYEKAYKEGYDKGWSDGKFVGANKWIPVSERLPEERGVYIVTEKVFSFNDGEHKGKFNIITERVEWSGEKWQRARFYEVIAWMPLPKPYVPQESEVSE